MLLLLVGGWIKAFTANIKYKVKITCLNQNSGLYMMPKNSPVVPVTS